jgi:lipopolysaccharide export system protein LptC
VNSIERRAAIETGQKVDRQDIKLRGGMNDQAEILRKTFTFEEMRVTQFNPEGKSRYLALRQHLPGSGGDSRIGGALC